MCAPNILKKSPPSATSKARGYRGRELFVKSSLPWTPTRKMLTGGEVIRQEFLLWKKVPGIFRELFFMQLPEGLKGNGFSVIFHFP